MYCTSRGGCRERLSGGSNLVTSPEPRKEAIPSLFRHDNLGLGGRGGGGRDGERREGEREGGREGEREGRREGDGGGREMKEGGRWREGGRQGRRTYILYTILQVYNYTIQVHPVQIQTHVHVYTYIYMYIVHMYLNRFGTGANIHCPLLCYANGLGSGCGHWSKGLGRK